MSRRKLLVLETHPIQYRAPVFQAYERLFPGEIEVVYASDFSVRGYRDAGFGTSFSWDAPLLSGYPHRVLDNLRAGGTERWSGLSAKDVPRLIRAARPTAILLHSLFYAFSWAACLAALRLRIPIWIRMETQDEAVDRSLPKAFVRHLVYRSAYLAVSRAFYIGELNRQHLLRHGVPSRRLAPARYCTADPLAALATEDKWRLRRRTRAALGIPDDHRIVAFFGKLIPKKDPAIVLAALKRLGRSADPGLTMLYVGSGELDAALRGDAAELESASGIRTVFAGFVNQAALPAHYLAADVLVLPSRRMGETWGLVVNEALQAGCAVAVSDAVGSARDFAGLERFRVFPVGSAERLATDIGELLEYPRSFDWAHEAIAGYSVEAAAVAWHDALQELAPRHEAR